MTSSNPQKGKSRVRLLADLQEFQGFVTGFWGGFAGFSIVFPLSNSLANVLWTPADEGRVFTVISTLTCLFAITVTFVNRASVRRWYDPQEELRRGYLLLRDRIAAFVRRLPVSGVVWAPLGIILAVMYFGGTVNLKRQFPMLGWQVWLNERGFLDGFLLFFYAATFGSLSAGFTLLAMREYVYQLAAGTTTGFVIGTTAPAIIPPPGTPSDTQGPEAAAVEERHLPVVSPATAREIEGRLAPFFQKRFCKEVEISLDQEVVEETDIRFVANRLQVRIVLEEGPLPDEWRFMVFGEPWLGRLLKARRSSRELYVVHRVARDGVALKPLETEEQGWKILSYQSRIEEPAGSVFEADYTFLSGIEDVYIFHLARFAREIKILLRKNPQLEYANPVVTGGFATLHPEKKGPFRDVISIEDEGMLFPGWACILHWRPRRPVGA